MRPDNYFWNRSMQCRNYKMSEKKFTSKTNTLKKEAWSQKNKIVSSAESYVFIKLYLEPFPAARTTA